MKVGLSRKGKKEGFPSGRNPLNFTNYEGIKHDIFAINNGKLSHREKTICLRVACRWLY